MKWTRQRCRMLGRHKLMCDDARETRAYAALLGDGVVDLICTDPPYNVDLSQKSGELF